MYLAALFLHLRHLKLRKRNNCYRASSLHPILRTLAKAFFVIAIFLKFTNDRLQDAVLCIMLIEALLLWLTFHGVKTNY
ncbi:hypothetical protein T4D_6260 [Trichinella pseudospiralis]|uniref:Uncharacterized protein n=1 Tax=Trichinella pseudospiralis TaxID=6337 RepID=A0A0V1FU14_TRIPS|nr:hypothetical protein T4D_6260 [Trichinella pseudospiralis]